MIAKQETAEQKLLKMIEVSGSQEASETQQKVSKEQSSLSLIKKCNWVLLIGLIVLLLFLANEIFGGVVLMAKDFHYDKKVVPAKVGSTDVQIVPQQQRLSYYLAGVDRRNIFMPYEDVRQQAGVSPSSPIVQKTARLRLVGVAWFESIDSATAMFEDVDKKVTYVLMKGEKIDDLTVKTIYADSVKVGYKDEEIILRYDKSQM